ncbi:MAG: hypothetical protein ACI9U0_000594 [Flavobacteriales bacterium]|jgi:hypothetical protein
MKNNKLISYLTPCVLILSACGGGGGESNTTSNKNARIPIPAMTVSTGSKDLVVDELLTINTILTVKDADQDFTVSIDYSGNGHLEQVINDDDITVKYTAPEVDRDIEEHFSVTTSDKDDAVTTLFSVSINNASALLAIASIEKLIVLSESQGYYEELKRVASIAIKMNSFTNQSKQNQSNLAMMTFEATKQSVLNETQYIEVDPVYLQEQIDSFNNGTSDESHLLSVIEGAASRITLEVGPILAELSRIISLSESIPTIPSYAFSINGNKYSGLIGNTEYGSFVDDEWVFSDEYTILESILLSPCSAQ